MRDRRLFLSTPVYTYSPHLSNGRVLSALLAGILLLTHLTFSATPTLHARPLTEEDVLPPTHMIANHVVISEVQIGGATSRDEFVEIYNPLDEVIEIGNWKLTKMTSGGDVYELIQLPVDAKIQKYGFYLIANNDYDGTVPEDATYTSANDNFSIATNNDVLLYNDQGQLIDRIGWRVTSYTGGDYPFDPLLNRSIERKAFYFSVTSGMAEAGVSTRGAHSFYGNSFDTDNYAQDFVRHTAPTISNPQNSSISTTPEPCCTTITGTLTRQGRADHTGTEVLLWPGSGLRATTDSSGYFSIPNVPAIASTETPTYTVEVSTPSYLSPHTTLDLRNHLVGGYLPASVTFPTLSLLSGDLTGDNEVNIFDLAIVGSHYGQIGVSPADVNGDGQVNIQDLALISGNFGRINEYVWSP